MFNYLFPIFCFGLVISGIVFLGLIEAAKQAESHALEERSRQTTANTSKAAPSRNGRSVSTAVTRSND